MALPKLETPKHRTELPTTKETVYFRPFLVGEQKQLLIAQESEDQNMVIREMIRLIDVCVDNVSSENLSTTDIEWLFLRVAISLDTLRTHQSVLPLCMILVVSP